MKYSINPTVYKSIFPVPVDLVDKHIRLANEHQLKVLLWILRNNPDNPDIDAMCKALRINKEDAMDYLQYWINSSVIVIDGEPANNIPAPAPQPTPTPKTEPVKAEIKNEEIIKPSKPSSAEIVARIEETPEIGHLFNEAQQKLGKTIGYDGQCTLILLHDHYGLPIEVLFMLIDYCVSVGKTNYSYIEAVGRDWGLKEIDTLDKAAEQILSLRNANSLWKEFSHSAGIKNPRPTQSQVEFLRRWSDEWKFGIDMILLAYEEMANHTGKLSFGYINKVLMNWHSKGFSTPADVANAESAKKTASSNKGTANPRTSSPSYDLDEFKAQSLHGELKYERKKKK